MFAKYQMRFIYIGLTDIVNMVEALTQDGVTQVRLAIRHFYRHEYLSRLEIRTIKTEEK